MPSDGASTPLGDGALLGPSFASDAVRAAVDDGAWLQAMLDVEAALAEAGADVGLVTRDEATAVTACCRAERFDLVSIGRRGALAGTPVIPLVADLRAQVAPGAGRAVHLGATSQDVIDTSLVLLAARTLPLLDAALGRAANAAATLADEHRTTLMPGRTLLQHAVPITFGLTAATWLVGLVDARSAVAQAGDRLAVQLGGAAGTLAALGSEGPAVVQRLAERLGLAAPPLPWHTARGRMVELVAALAGTAGALGKVATDVIALAQTEVAEVHEPTGEGRGGSSAMPHKQNPTRATFVVAAAHRVVGAAGVVLGAQLQVHQRAAGPWQAEWQPVREALELTAGAAEAVAEILGGLEVDAERMRADLDLTNGLVMSEAVTIALIDAGVDAAGAGRAVGGAARLAAATGQPFATALRDDPTVSAALDDAALAAALDPARHLGASAAFVDQALLHRKQQEHDHHHG